MLDFVRSTTEMVPDVAAPFTGSATIGVPADQIWKSFSVATRRPSLLILGGRAIDHDAVRRVADPDLHALRWRRLGQVDLGEGVILVEQGVCALAVLGERDVARIGCGRNIERGAARRPDLGNGDVACCPG